MDYQHTLNIGFGIVIGAAAALHLIVYIALKAHGVDIHFARSIKPGIIENLYKRHKKSHSLLLGAAVRLSSLSKITAALAAAAFFVLRSIGR